MSTTVGRLESAEVGKTLVSDEASNNVRALMSKMDEVIDALKALGDKLDADGGVDTDYGSTITDALAKIELTI